MTAFRKINTSFTHILTLSMIGVLSTFLICCDDDGFQSGQSADYVVKPVDQFNFSTLIVGEESSQVLEIENIGSADLLFASIFIQISSSEPNEFSISGQKISAMAPIEETNFTPFEYEESRQGDQLDFDYPFSISPGERYVVKVTYTPKDERIDQGAIYFDTNVLKGEGDEASRLRLPITVAQGGPQLLISPPQIDFGAVPAGDERLLKVTLSNVGQSPLLLDELRIDGSQDFTPLINGRDPRRQPELLDDPDGDGTPGLAPFNEELNQGGRIEIEVRYLPPTSGPDEGTLVILSNDANRRVVNVPLLANSNSPCIEVLPNALEFPASLRTRTDSQPLLIESCGGGALSVTEVYIDDNPEGIFSLEGALSLPINLPAASSQGIRPSYTLPVSFTPREEKIYNATLVLVSNDPVQPEKRVSLLGRGAENICPQARVVEDEFAVLPLDTIVLDGTPSVDQDGPDNLPIEYEWVVTSRPPGSVSQPYERFDNPVQPADGGRPDDITTPTAVFFVDLPGTYTIELRVVDQFRLDSVACNNPGGVTIVATPPDAIQVQLTWEAVEETDAMRERAGDLDLHLRHPLGGDEDGWFQDPYDCYFNNPTPDWGQLSNSLDDPFLDLDDFQSNGPENLVLSAPESTADLGGDYTVAVHYYSQRDRIDGFMYGALKAFVRIFINGELVWDFNDDGQGGFKTLEAEGHFWEAATISWDPSINIGEVTTRDVYYEMVPE